jgi:hypothetical protein
MTIALPAVKRHMPATERSFAWRQDEVEFIHNGLKSKGLKSSGKETRQMSASLRALTVLAAATAMSANAASAADYSVDKAHQVSHRAHYRYWYVHAPSELIAGVRGASPLTVPFFGYGWLPGPVYYYQASPSACCFSANERAISVKY